MTVTLTDHEQRFADSAKGRMMIARAASEHRIREAYKGSAALPWTDAMEADAARRLAVSEARSTVATAAFIADSARKLPGLRAEAEAARADANERIRTAYLKR